MSLDYVENYMLYIEEGGSEGEGGGPLDDFDLESSTNIL